MFETEKRLFVDIDGTLAVWQVGTPYEELLKRGYFRSLPVHDSVVQAVRVLLAKEKHLHAWEQAGGKGIKLMNGINGTKGTWNGLVVSRFASPEHTEIQILRALGLWPEKSEKA